MLQTVTASGFNRDWDGVYEYQYQEDHWKNGDYWIYRDSWYWYIANSGYQYIGEHNVAKLAVTSVNNTPILDPRGSYTGTNGEPNGSVS